MREAQTSGIKDLGTVEVVLMHEALDGSLARSLVLIPIIHALARPAWLWVARERAG
jgi:hypothetical protein